MAAKILAGLLAAVALTGVGIYAATGSVPGVETIAEVITAPAPTGGCGGSRVASASTCPSLAASSCSESEVFSPAEPAAACFGGFAIALDASTAVSTPSGCCAK